MNSIRGEYTEVGLKPEVQSQRTTASGERREAIHRFFAPKAAARGDRIALPEDEAHHLRHVVRLDAGAAVRVFDGRSREWEARVELPDKQHVIVVLEREVVPVPEPPAVMTLAIAVLKSDYMDEAVRNAAMIGVSSIQPLMTTRTSVSIRADRSSQLVARWQRIALASVKQSGRALVPDIAGPCSICEWLARPALPELRIVLTEPALARTGEGKPDFKGWLARACPGAGVVLVGPEGGWTPEEVERVQRAGFVPWTVSRRILRADATPAIALSILFYEWEFE